MQPDRLSALKAMVILIVCLLLIAACNPTPTPSAQIQTTLSFSTQVVNTLIPPLNTATPTEPPDDTDTPEPSPSPTLAPTVAATISPGQARDLLIAAFKKLNTAYPYRLTENTMMGGQSFDRVTEFAAADRSHATFSNGTEIFFIGAKYYSKNAEGQWVSSDRPPNPNTQLDLAVALINGIKSAEFAGTEAITGVDCLVITYQLQMTLSGVPVSGTGKAWIGIADGLPHQSDFTGTLSSVGIKTHIVYDEYGHPFDIQAPK